MLKLDEIKFKDTTFFISRILKDEAIFCNKETYERLVNLINAFNELEEENEQLRHELDSLTGCYCADNKEFKDYWRIGYDD